MTQRARVALFIASSLVFACSSHDEGTKKKSEDAHPAEARVEQSAAKTSTLLAATSPAQPPSIVDAPAPKVEERTVEGVQAPAPRPIDDKSMQSEAPEVDYDRALDPSEVEIDRFVLATDVQDREPLNATDTFTTETKKIFAFVQLANRSAPYAFRVHFEKLDEEPKPYGVKLTVPSAPRHRTWAWTALEREPGLYKAVLRTLDGKDIDSREFTIEPANLAEDCVD